VTSLNIPWLRGPKTLNVLSGFLDKNYSLKGPPSHFLWWCSKLKGKRDRFAGQQVGAIDMEAEQGKLLNNHK